jgi:hypothetical protein
MVSETRSIEDRLGSDTLQVIVQYASESADLVSRFLRQEEMISKRRGKKTWKFPSVFLLELGAILQIGRWEANGLRSLIPVELPKAAVSLVRLSQWVAAGDPTVPPFTPPLHDLVFRTWMHHCWPWSRTELGVDAIVRGQITDVDSAIDALAEFLWLHLDSAQTEETPDAQTTGE